MGQTAPWQKLDVDAAGIALDELGEQLYQLSIEWDSAIDDIAREIQYSQSLASQIGKSLRRIEQLVQKMEE